MEINYSPVTPTKRSSKVLGRSKVRLSPDASGHLIHALINQYSDGAAAVIREYSSNARDAHVAAGKTDVPIEVTLPTESNPTLKIRDYGVGLDREGLDNYVEIGTSSKRKDKRQTGAWGMGCKSGLAVADHFNVVAVKDGIKRFSVVGGNDEGELSLDVLKEIETDEENGVEVRIPFDSSRRAEIREKAERFSSFWNKGSVLIDGVEPKNWLDESSDHYVTEYGEVAASGRFGRHLGGHPIQVAMGNVTYPVDMETLRSILQSKIGVSISHGFRHNASVLLRAKIGDLDLPPARDSVNYTERTAENLWELLVKTEQKVREAVAENVSKAESYAEAEKAILRSRKVLSEPPQVSFRGIEYSPEVKTVSKEQVSGISFEMGNLSLSSLTSKTATIHIPSGHSMYVGSPNPEASRTLIVFREEDYPMESLKVKSWRRKFADWMIDKDTSSAYYVAGKVDLENPWIFDNGNIKIVSAKDVEERVKEVRREARAALKAAGVSTTSSGNTEVRHSIAYGGKIHTRDIAISTLPESVTKLYYTEGSLESHFRELIVGTDDSALVLIRGNRSVDIFIKRAEEAGKTALQIDEFRDNAKAKIKANPAAKAAVEARFKDMSVPRGIYRDMLNYLRGRAPFTDEEVKKSLRELTVCGVSIGDLESQVSYDTENLSEEDSRAVSVALSSLFAEMSEGLEEIDLPGIGEVHEAYPMLEATHRFQAGRFSEVIIDYINLMNKISSD